ncbi:ATP-binding protein [Chryseolinea sp. T2]|uniref:sensor histidine kinase n=1 Tax=Chryseolinea sp. T2 TaxID=3129255 RepID=UPI0030780EDA
MVSKHFTLQVLFRVLVLTALLGTLMWCVVNELWLRSMYAGVACVGSLIELLWFLDRFQRDFRTFLISLLHRDFTIHFEQTGRGKRLNALYDAMNQISSAFKKVSAEREAKHRFLELLVEHVQVGIISFNDEEQIHLINKALKNMLQLPLATPMDKLRGVDPALQQVLREIKAGETRLVKVKAGQDTLHLTVHATAFRLEEDFYKLVSMQNIRSELDAREMEAWQKLIRVLTHEIMNSISPITSLSGTLHSMVSAYVGKEPPPTLLTTLDEGLDAIKKRSEGLLSFTEVYRKLTRVPTPVIKPTNVLALLRRMQLLFHEELSRKSITLSIDAHEQEILVDSDLMEQALINLIRNAIDALEGRSEPAIQLSHFVTPDGRSMITISDNGDGIEPDKIDSIFIPFFTTKKNGSGIGLAITKQIVLLHGGSIKVNSTVGRGTEFSVYL